MRLIVIPTSGPVIGRGNWPGCNHCCDWLQLPHDPVKDQATEDEWTSSLMLVLFTLCIFSLQRATCSQQQESLWRPHRWLVLGGSGCGSSGPVVFTHEVLQTGPLPGHLDTVFRRGHGGLQREMFSQGLAKEYRLQVKINSSTKSHFNKDLICKNVSFRHLFKPYFGVVYHYVIIIKEVDDCTTFSVQFLLLCIGSPCVHWFPTAVQGRFMYW